MSTTVTVAVAEPNHLPVKVTVQEQRMSYGVPVWCDSNDSTIIKVGGAHNFMVYKGRRFTVEEIE